MMTQICFYVCIYAGLSSIDPEFLCEGSPGEVHKQAIDLMGQVECRGHCRCVFHDPGSREVVAQTKSDNLEPKF